MKTQINRKFAQLLIEEGDALPHIAKLLQQIVLYDLNVSYAAGDKKRIIKVRDANNKFVCGTIVDEDNYTHYEELSRMISAYFRDKNLNELLG